MMVSEHFSLRELTRTDVRGVDNTPDESQMMTLRLLCSTILEPLRFRFGPIHINSAFRSQLVNSRIGGVSDSSHCYGAAADLEPVSACVSLEDMARWLGNSGIGFDQCILEYPPGGWLHVSVLRPYHEPEPRRELLIFDGHYRVWTP